MSVLRLFDLSMIDLLANHKQSIMTTERNIMTGTERRRKLLLH